jgi:hypothetical protein
MIFLKKAAFVAALATTTILASGQLMAQETSANLRGTVVDTRGNAVSNVTVKVVHVPTGTTQTITTDGSGRFQARGLLVGGPYQVSLSDGSSFEADSLENVFTQLGATQTVTLSVQRAGEAIEEIVVTGSKLNAGIKTGAGRDFNQSQIENIPSISRDFVSILETDSKILVDKSVPRGPAVSIAGQNFRFNSVTVDGVAQNDNFGLSMNASATQRTPISIDAIGAINVNIAPFDVTYGNFLGGNINIVTKSGSNEFSGSAYGFFTNDSLTGDTSKGEDLAIGEFSEKTYGATFGGPIIEDKLFFFANYEKFSTTLPANTQTIGNIVGVTQGDVDRAVQIFQDVYGFDSGTFATTDEDNDEKILLKLDLNISDNHRASATYQRAKGDVIFDDFPQLAILNSGRYNINEKMDSYSLQLFSSWSDNLSTEIKLGYKDVENRQVSIDSSTPDFLVNAPGGGVIAAGGDRFRHANTLDNTSRIFRFKADYIMGDHTITAGFEQEHNSVDNLFLPYSRGHVQFLSLDDLEDRNPFIALIGGSNTGNQDDARAKFSLDTNSIYLQDEWYASEKLTLTAGVRYDWMKNDDAIPENANFIARNGFTNTTNLDGKDMILPRFGFNYEADDRLTIRGGAGLFGGGSPMIMLSNSYAANGLTRTFASFWADFFGAGVEDMIDTIGANLPSPTAVSDVLGFALQTNPDADVDALHPDFELLSSWKYNLAFDYVADLSDWGMGDDWNFTAEAIVTNVKNGYDIIEGRREVIGTAPDGRNIYNNTDTCGTFFNCADYIVTNTSEGGSKIISLDVGKNWTRDSSNYSMTLGYTYQDVEDVRSYNRFINFESFAFDPQADLNNPDLATSKFEIPHRITATFGWEKEIFGENKTKVNVVYTGRSGRNFSYIYNGNAITFGGNFLADAASPDNPGPNLFYVPTSAADPLVTGTAGFLSSLDNVIKSDSCLSDNRGQIIARNACRTGWTSQVNIRFLQEAKIAGSTVEFILDVENLGNMVNSDWGRLDAIFQPSNVALANVDIVDGQYVYSGLNGSDAALGAVPNIARSPSVYKIQFGMRVRF